MEVTIKAAAEKKEMAFPKFMKSTVADVIVLMEGETPHTYLMTPGDLGTGTCVGSNSPCYTVGEHSETWSINMFVDFDGEVILSN